MDDYTFGDSKAEVALAQILTKENSTRLTKVVSNMLGSLGTHLRNIHIKNEELKTRMVLYNALRKFYLDNVNNSWVATEYPKVTTFLKNAIVKRVNTFRKDEFKPREPKGFIYKMVKEIRRKTKKL